VWRYSGEYFDKETSSIYLRARYYQPANGRFITEDSVWSSKTKLGNGKEIDDPLSLNLYTYCENDPVNNIDPTGHVAETAIDVASALWSAYDFWNKPSWENAGYLGWDVAAVALPFVPGSWTVKAVKAGGKLITKADDLARISKKLEVLGDARKFWTKATDFKGIKVYQRNDIIDPKRMDARGRTNVQRMEQGLAPIGSDGKSVNLHHMIQTNDSAIVELTQSFHQRNTKTIHINPSSIPSGINRTQFDKWRESYWINRANDFK
jgi:RHS repeat-associated protein